MQFPARLIVEIVIANGAEDDVGVLSEALFRLLHDRVRQVEPKAGIGSRQRHERLPVQVIGVDMAGRDTRDAGQKAGIDAALGHPHMRLVGLGVFFGQRVRQVGIKQDALTGPLHQEAALAEPPDMQDVIGARGRSHVCEQSLVLLKCGDHGFRLRIESGRFFPPCRDWRRRPAPPPPHAKAGPEA